MRETVSFPDNFSAKLTGRAAYSIKRSENVIFHG